MVEFKVSLTRQRRQNAVFQELGLCCLGFLADYYFIPFLNFVSGWVGTVSLFHNTDDHDVNYAYKYWETVVVGTDPDGNAITTRIKKTIDPPILDSLGFNLMSAPDGAGWHILADRSDHAFRHFRTGPLRRAIRNGTHMFSSLDARHSPRPNHARITHRALDHMDHARNNEWK